jgi:hypothetical protein
MDRLAEQIVAWHNRHPLARRASVGDVHTIGVVALPFLRATAQAGGLVEPVLTEAVTFDELAAAPKPSRSAAWAQRLGALGRLAALLRPRPRTQWRAFNERFLAGLSPARVERFALAHGFSEPPATPEARPWRVVVIDEALAGAHGGWPFELYLMSAGLDIGKARTRVLAGRSIPSQIIGRRLLDPKRVALAVAVPAVLAAAGAGLWWALRDTPPAAPPAPVAAAAASAPPATAEPASAASAASGPDTLASAPEAGAAAASATGLPVEASASAADDAASEPPRDIRPRLVERRDGKIRPPMLRSEPQPDKAAEKPTEKTSEKTAEKTAEKPAEKSAEKAAEKPRAAASDPRLSQLAQAPAKRIVALVGPPGSKAEAEALLKKMRAGLVGVHSNPEALQADVIQTPEGWRATIWPFPSREQAQLINATLVARGMKTKAVDF